MPYSRVPTLLSLQQWAETMGLNLWEFNQWGTGFPKTNEAQCGTVWYQYPWQVDFMCRDEIGEAIAQAEDLIFSNLNFYPAPKFVVDEPHPYPRPNESQMFGAMGTQRGQWKSIQLRSDFVEGPGLLARTLIDDVAAVTLADWDGDGLNDHFLLSVATSVTDPDEIAVYFSSADRLPAAAAVDEQWRVRPVTVSIAGGVAVISGHASMLALPALHEAYKPANLDVGTAGNYATTLAVYRLYRDASAGTHGIAIWEQPPSSDYITGAVSYVTDMYVIEKDSQYGQIAMQIDPANWPFDNEPDRVKVNYRAGVPLENGRMSHRYAVMVARLATSLLTSPKCGCERWDAILSNWRMLPSETHNQRNRPLVMEEVLGNPYNPTMGGSWAWHETLLLRHERAGSIH